MSKILEYKNLDWMKGQSAQPNVPMGGLFESFLGCDPFEQGGLALPSLVPDSKSLATTPKFMTSINISGVGYINVLTQTKIYQVLQNSPYTVTDQTAGIDQHLPFGTAINHNGLTTYQGRNVYVTYGNATTHYYINGNAPAWNNDVFLYDVATTFGAESVAGSFMFRFCEGADGNLYFGMVGNIGVLTSATAPSGSTHLIDSDFVVRDIVNDGRYLVIFADNNAQDAADRTTGSFKCKVYFWDMVQTDANGRIVCDVIWEFSDSYIIGAKVVEGNTIQMVTYNGIWILNVATFPKMIRPFPTTTLARMGKPINAEQIVYTKGSLYWVDGSVNTNFYIYAYGNPITGQQKIFYVPYSTQGVNGVSQALLVSGKNFILGNDNPALWFFNVGSTRGSVSVTSLDVNMGQPHTYDYTKVVLGQKLASGQQVQVVAYGNGGNDLISSEIKTYAQVGAKQTLKFNPVRTTTNQPNKLEDIIVGVTATGASLQRVATYGTPSDDANVDL